MNNPTRQAMKRALYRACREYVDRSDRGESAYNTYKRIFKLCRRLDDGGWAEKFSHET